MGFFSKIWKGIKKGFKAVFKPIKKVFKSFGKFMNKLGIAGQIAMLFIPIPGLGALFSGLGGLGKAALNFMTKFGAVGKGAATLLGSAAKFAGAIAKPFINVTKAVKGFFENVTRYVGSKIPGVSGLFDPSKTPSGIFGGTDSAWGRASGAISKAFDGFKGDIQSAFSMDISDLLPDATSTGQVAPVTPATSLESASPTVGEGLPTEPDYGQAVVPGKVPDWESDYSTDGLPTKPYYGHATPVPPTTPTEVKVDPDKTTDKESWFEKAKSGVVKSITETPQRFSQSLLDAPGDFAIDKGAEYLFGEDTPEVYKPFKGMYIAPVDPYRYSRAASELPIFGQQGGFINEMSAMGLLGGGYDALSTDSMGYGGSAYNDTYAQTFKQLAPGY
jgi:hypothetical protein